MMKDRQIACIGEMRPYHPFSGYLYDDIMIYTVLCMFSEYYLILCMGYDKHDKSVIEHSTSVHTAK